MVSTQNSRALCGGVPIRLRVGTAAASAVRTQVALFAIRRQSVARDVRAAAVPTCNFDCDH